MLYHCFGTSSTERSALMATTMSALDLNESARLYSFKLVPVQYLWRKAYAKFMRQRSRLEVVQRMVQLGISVDSKRRMFIGNLEVCDTALARAAGVDRRVVRNTINQIFEDPELREIFTKVSPVGPSLVEIAGLLGYSVLVVAADLS